MSTWVAIISAALLLTLLVFEELSRSSSDIVTAIRMLMLAVLAFVAVIFVAWHDWALKNYVWVVGVGCVIFLSGFVGQVSLPGMLSLGEGYDVTPAGMLAIFVIYGFLRLPLSVSVLVSAVFSFGLAFVLARDGVGAGFYRSIIYLGFANFFGVVLARELQRHERISWEERRRAIDAEAVAHGRAEESSFLLESRMALVAGINHDLAQPALALEASLSLAIKRLERGDAASVRGDLITAKDSLGYLRDSLLHLMNVAQADMHGETVRVTPIDANEILDRVIDQFTLAVGGNVRSAEVEVDRRFGSQSCLVMSDSGHLNQIFANVIGNAVKFARLRSGGGGKVIVRAQVRERFLFVDIVDNGPGIPRDYRERIWGFYDRGSQGAAAPGSGLGLGLVRHAIARLPDHAISFKSRVGRGTRFRVTMPLADIAPDKVGGEFMLASSKAESLGRVIVVIERDSEFCEGVCRVLDALGCNVIRIQFDDPLAVNSIFEFGDGRCGGVSGIVYCAQIGALGDWVEGAVSILRENAQSMPLVVATRMQLDIQREFAEKHPTTCISWLSSGFGPVDLLNALGLDHQLSSL
jgi:signal transduction histidine kinase